MQELLGGKAKITDEILHLFTVSSKMYCGQLTEEARLIQIEELANKYGGHKYLPENLNLPPIEPGHLQEARRRLILQGGVFVEPRPQKMFKK